MQRLLEPKRQQVAALSRRLKEAGANLRRIFHSPQLAARPAPATHRIWASLEAGGCLRQTILVPKQCFNFNRHSQCHKHCFRDFLAPGW